MSEEEHDHIVPLKYTIRTYLTLLVLTGATIGFAMFDFSILNEYLPRNMDLFPLNIVVALAIATLKAAFVLGFFMAIAYDKHLNKAIVLMNFVFVTVLFGLTLSDTMFRSVADPMEGKKIPFDSPVINANKNPATIQLSYLQVQKPFSFFF